MTKRRRLVLARAHGARAPPLETPHCKGAGRTETAQHVDWCGISDVVLTHARCARARCASFAAGGAASSPGLLTQAESERVPGKNFRLLCGRPLYAWTLSALLACKRIDRVVINTDSTTLADEIATHFPDDTQRIQVRALALTARRIDCVDLHLPLVDEALARVKQVLRRRRGRPACRRAAPGETSQSFTASTHVCHARRCWIALNICVGTPCL